MLWQGRFLLQESHLAGFLLVWRIFDPDGIGRIPLCQFRYLCEVSMALMLIVCSCTVRLCPFRFLRQVSNLLRVELQELRLSHNALGMVNRFTFALLRAELSVNTGDASSFLLLTAA